MTRTITHILGVRIAAVPVLALVGGQAAGAVYSFESTGSVVIFSPSNGLDTMFPYVGLSEGDAMDFRFNYDADAAPTIPGDLATYVLPGAGSFVRLGDAVVEFDEVRILVGGSPFGGTLSFTGVRSDIGFEAQISFSGPNPVASSLPTTLDLGVLPHEISMANSDLQQILIPVVMGDLATARIIPAPAGAALLAVGLLAVSRRRR